LSFCVVVLVVVYRVVFDIVSNARCSNSSSGYVTTVSVRWLQLSYISRRSMLFGVCLFLEVMSGLLDFLDSADYSSSMQCGICKRVLKGEGGKWSKG
jgi:hypothetical protein